ncbi:MAG: divergent polysaccharide deacetylase family protein [Acidobacteria bacterium]|nr:divergent polysaccharide deacetylase family protein [Acidobacteriota bacterium]
MAIEENVPSAERKVFLDDDNSDSAIILKLDELALLAQKEKKAVAIGHLRYGTIKVLESRIAYWQKRGLKFVSLKELIEGYGTGN